MKQYILLTVIITILLIFGLTWRDQQKVDPAYACSEDTDCVHSCGMKCINAEWAQNYTDPCSNIRGYDCTCVNKQCFSDGKPPRV